MGTIILKLNINKINLDKKEIKKHYKPRYNNIFKGNPYKWYRPESFMWFLHSFECAWLRITRGYCYRDLWSMDIWLSQLLYDSLKDFSDSTHSSPADMEYKEWITFIESIRDSFYKSMEENQDEVNPNKYKEYLDRPLKFEKGSNGLYSLKEDETKELKELRDNWYKEEIKIRKAREEEKNKALESLKERWFDLWN